jgi:hypothetical protein
MVGETETLVYSGYWETWPKTVLTIVRERYLTCRTSLSSSVGDRKELIHYQAGAACISTQMRCMQRYAVTVAWSIVTYVATRGDSSWEITHKTHYCREAVRTMEIANSGRASQHKNTVISGYGSTCGLNQFISATIWSGCGHGGRGACTHMSSYRCFQSVNHEFLVHPNVNLNKMMFCRECTFALWTRTQK